MTIASLDYPKLEQERRALLPRLAGLGELRRGSLSDQFLLVKHADGSVVERGPNPLPNSGAGAFSLLDLLVVLGTIAVLVLVAVPRLARAGQSDPAAACLNNHRQLALAWSLYATDNGGRLVSNFGLADVQATVNQKTYLNWANNVMDWTPQGMNTNLTLVAFSKLFPYLQSNLLAFACPADTFLASAQRQMGWTARVRSYSMNAFMGRPAINVDSTTLQGRNAYFPSYRHFLLQSSIPKPSGTFVFLDEHPDSINDGFFLNDPARATSWADVPASYHNGACGLAFADGHAEMRVWQYSSTRVPVRYLYTSTVIPSAQSGDYRWLAARTSVDPATLAAVRAGSNQLQVIWSALPTNTYVLQARESLVAGAWTNLGVTPTKSWGQNSVTLTLQGQQRFFWLARP